MVFNAVLHMRASIDIIALGKYYEFEIQMAAPGIA
jgi:hypothetical protein